MTPESWRRLGPHRRSLSWRRGRAGKRKGEVGSGGANERPYGCAPVARGLVEGPRPEHAKRLAQEVALYRAARGDCDLAVRRTAADLGDGGGGERRKAPQSDRRQSGFRVRS